MPNDPAQDDPVGIIDFDKAGGLVTAIAQDEPFRLHPKLAAVNAGITAVVVGVSAVGGAVTLAIFGLWWWLPAVAAVATLLPWLTLVHGRRYARGFRCELLAAGVVIRRGIWWRSQVFVPRGRVQHTDVDQGPLARRFGMATLKLFTAGSAHSEIAVEGMHHEDALRIRDDLLARHARRTD